MNELSRADIAKIQRIDETRMYIRWAVVTLILLIALFWAWRLVNPRYVLYQANIERQVQVADARAKAEAADLLAEAETKRARGVAEANEIIADSITPEYTRWLYVDQLDEIEGQIIYIPTEAGIPILEARPTGVDE